MGRTSKQIQKQNGLTPMPASSSGKMMTPRENRAKARAAAPAAKARDNHEQTGGDLTTVVEEHPTGDPSVNTEGLSGFLSDEVFVLDASFVLEDTFVRSYALLFMLRLTTLNTPRC